jgi:hypothetical protein
MPVKIESQKENLPNVLPENGNAPEVKDSIQDKEHEPEKANSRPNHIEELLDRNLDAKKQLADELSDMGLPVDEILKILHLDS